MGIEMVKTKKIDWDELFKMNPTRYLKVYSNETKELIEVHDTENGNVWFKITDGTWMFVN